MSDIAHGPENALRHPFDLYRVWPIDELFIGGFYKGTGPRTRNPSKLLFIAFRLRHIGASPLRCTRGLSNPKCLCAALYYFSAPLVGAPYGDVAINHEPLIWRPHRAVEIWSLYRRSVAHYNPCLITSNICNMPISDITLAIVDQTCKNVVVSTQDLPLDFDIASEGVPKTLFHIGAIYYEKGKANEFGG